MKKPEIVTMKNGATLTVYYLMPREAIKLLKFMLSTVGGSFSALKGFDFSLDSKLTELKGDLIASFITKFVEFDEDELIKWCEVILLNVEIDGKRAKFADFQGDLVTMFAIVKVALEVNYKDFFDVLTGNLGAVFKKIKN